MGSCSNLLTAAVRAGFADDKLLTSELKSPRSINALASKIRMLAFPKLWEVFSFMTSRSRNYWIEVVFQQPIEEIQLVFHTMKALNFQNCFAEFNLPLNSVKLNNKWI
ncbi:hypothetical protein Goshw_015867 [Gossypium schwendimanii]|uniref:Uncharacterized protein n=1 Tax=Gossypium schwendimanii TaxID=34291 RepID=A0A7J9LNP4_GOSSC|nr:hypothetical protein [Gossypium schwendimanii]